MNRYLVEFTGRENGSLGYQRQITLRVEAESEEHVRMAISRTHEFWYVLSITSAYDCAGCMQDCFDDSGNPNPCPLEAKG
jgi:hypothetical protein